MFNQNQKDERTRTGRETVFVSLKKRTDKQFEEKQTDSIRKDRQP